ncbi:MAG: protease modulator HflK [Sedimentisphaerales bacterium]|nr:protease modulator HflK [Sedimentisphaerales bacterium]
MTAIHNHNHNHNHEHEHVDSQADIPIEELDAGSKSLADALRISFFVLKFIMIALVIFFFGSGVFTVGPDERAMVLRFGKIRGDTSDKRILTPGLHWAVPSPVDEIIRFPGRNTVERVTLDAFWYDETKKRPGLSLDPVVDGYCLTRNDSVADLRTGNDYNIVHSRWLLTYRISDCELFLKNIYVKDAPAGQNYIDVIGESVEPMLRALACDAIITTMVQFSIDEAIKSDADISRQASKVLQAKLDDIESGIEIDSMQITAVTWPRQVEDAFIASIKASNDADRIIREAKGYAESKINEAGGAEIINAFSNPDVTEPQMEYYWANASGQVRQTISEAKAYRTKVVESAKANADYLVKLLPQYRKRPRLVLERIYYDAMEEILGNTDENIIAQPGSDVKNKEFRIMINRDPALKKGGQKKVTEK